MYLSFNPKSLGELTKKSLHGTDAGLMPIDPELLEDAKISQESRSHNACRSTAFTVVRNRVRARSCVPALRTAAT